MVLALLMVFLECSVICLPVTKVEHVNSIFLIMPVIPNRNE